LSDEVLGDVRARVFRSTPSGDVWRIVEPSGTCVDYAHDDEHRIVCTTGPDGSQSTVEFDDDGAVVSTTFPDGSSEFIEPGQWGTPARIVGRDGRVTEAEVDELGQITCVTDPSGATTRLEYQWAGSGSVLAAITDPRGLTTRVECDAAGREVARTDAAGLRSSVTRDVLGRPVGTMDPAGVTEQLSGTPESWLAGVTHADGTGIANVYDGEGNLVACTNEIGATTTTEFTVFDKPVAATDASGAVTRLVYNTQMELAAVVNADGHRWDFTRDLDGVVVAERDYNGLTTRFAHDPAERWSTQIAPDGTEQVTVRDVLGRPVRADSIDGTVSWDWDETTGRLLGVSSPEATIRYAHDEQGRRVGEMVRLVTGEVSSVEYRVDHTGVPTAKTLTLPDGTVVDEVYSRDEFDRVSAMTVTAGISGAEDAHELAHLGFGVDAAGRRDRVSVGSLVRQYRYDSRGRRDGDRVLALGDVNPGGSRGSSVVAGREYTWRAESVVTGISDLLAGPIGLDVDELGRVTGVTRRQSTDPATGDYLDPWTTGSNAHSTGPKGQTSGAQAVREFYSFTTAGVLDRVDPGADFRDTEPTSGGGSSRTGSGAAARGKPENLARLAGQAALSAGGDTGEAGVGSASEAVVGVDLDGTLVTRVGRTRLHYDACGRVVRTVSKRLSRKPLVREFTYGATGQVRGFSCSDDPDFRWVYVYDGLARRVAKEKIHASSREVVHRTVFAHDGDRIVGEQTTVNSPRHRAGLPASHSVSGLNNGRVWVTDPATGELLGQVTLGGSNSPAAAAATGPRLVAGVARPEWLAHRNMSLMWCSM
jgi:YD repeat-containing protein